MPQPRGTGASWFPLMDCHDPFRRHCAFISAIPRPSAAQGLPVDTGSYVPVGLWLSAWSCSDLSWPTLSCATGTDHAVRSSSPRRRRAPTTPMKTRRPSSRKLIRCPTTNLAEASNSGAFAGAFILASGSRRRLSLPALDAAVIKDRSKCRLRPNYHRLRSAVR